LLESELIGKDFETFRQKSGQGSPINWAGRQWRATADEKFCMLDAKRGEEMRLSGSAEKCSKTETGFDASGVKLEMIGIETGADNFELADFDWTKERGVNFGETENKPGTPGFVAEPGCDAVLH
jgi:hypothetical protein